MCCIFTLENFRPVHGLGLGSGIWSGSRWVKMREGRVRVGVEVSLG
jgi:hypothetical protein